MQRSATCLLAGLCCVGNLSLAGDGIFPSPAKPTEILNRGAGEGPAWHPRVGLLFSGDGGINRLTGKGELEVFRGGTATNGLFSMPRADCCAARRRIVASRDRSPTEGSLY